MPFQWSKPHGLVPSNQCNTTSGVNVVSISCESCAAYTSHWTPQPSPQRGCHILPGTPGTQSDLFSASSLSRLRIVPTFLKAILAYTASLTNTSSIMTRTGASYP